MLRMHQFKTSLSAICCCLELGRNSYPSLNPFPVMISCRGTFLIFVGLEKKQDVRNGLWEWSPSRFWEDILPHCIYKFPRPDGFLRPSHPHTLVYLFMLECEHPSTIETFGLLTWECLQGLSGAAVEVISPPPFLAVCSVCWELHVPCNRYCGK